MTLNIYSQPIFNGDKLTLTYPSYPNKKFNEHNMKRSLNAYISITISDMMRLSYNNFLYVNCRSSVIIM